jgi:DNA-binding NarL/FixJ family response regulator
MRRYSGRMKSPISLMVLRASANNPTPLLPPTPVVSCLADRVLGDESFTELARLAPAVVLLDLRSIVPGEIAPVIKRVRLTVPHSRVVALGAAGSEAAAQQAIAAGASSFLSTNITAMAVLQAVEAVADGEMHLTRTGRRAVKLLLGGGIAPPPKS